MRNRVAESQISYGGLSIGNALEGEVVGLQNASRELNSLELASRRGDNGTSLGKQRNFNPVLSRWDNDTNLPVNSCQQRCDDN